MKLSFPFLGKLQFAAAIFKERFIPKPFSCVLEFVQFCWFFFFCLFFFFSQLPEQISNIVSFWLFFSFFQYLAIISPSSPSTHLTRLYLRILQSDSKTVYCYKQCLISDYYIFQLKIWTFHVSFSISLCGVSTCKTQGTASISESDLVLADTARTLFRLAKQEEKQNQTAFLGLFRRAGNLMHIQ